MDICQIKKRYKKIVMLNFIKLHDLLVKINKIEYININNLVISNEKSC